MNWDEYFINMLDSIAVKSNDPNTKCAAIIIGQNNNIISTGYNGFPRGANDHDKAKWQKPEKYFWVEHAERNAIYNAALNGTKLESTILYASHFPCIDCARGIVNSGIIRVIVSNKNLDAFSHKDSMYYEHKNKTIEMFRQTKVTLKIFGEEDNSGDFLDNEDLTKLWGV